MNLVQIGIVQTNNIIIIFWRSGPMCDATRLNHIGRSRWGIDRCEVLFGTHSILCYCHCCRDLTLCFHFREASAWYRLASWLHCMHNRKSYRMCPVSSTDGLLIRCLFFLTQLFHPTWHWLRERDEQNCSWSPYSQPGKEAEIYCK
jgi:hypothetical protein